MMSKEIIIDYYEVTIRRLEIGFLLEYPLVDVDKDHLRQ